MSGDAVTFCRAIKPPVVLAKTIVVRCGEIVEARPAPNAFLFAFRQVRINSLADLGTAVEEAAQRGEIAVRSKPKGPTGRRAIYDDEEKGPAGLEVVPRRWVAFDWDGLPLTPIPAEPAPGGTAADEAEPVNWLEADPLLDAEIGVRHALRRLPPPFRDVACFWQISASAGFKPGFRLRTWHWLGHPTTGAELKTWLAPAISRGLVDPVTLVEAQPHYLSVRIVGGPDPCPRRFGQLRGAREEVPVPNIAGIKRRQEQREREEWANRIRLFPQRRGAQTATSYAQDRIDQCTDAVCRAGARHPTYKTEAARAKAICDRHGLDWAPVRQALIDAYESTLTGAEVRARRKFSTEGVMSWLEGRAR
jgi:hypothetical protein